MIGRRFTFTPVRYRLRAVSLGCVALLSSAVLLTGVPRNAGWSLLLISIDTLRADHLGAYGYRPSVTPYLDEISRQSALFEDVITPVPLTLPAHTAMLTSEYPPVNGVRDNGEALRASVPTMAQQLYDHGFQTAAFVGSFILDRRFGLAKGFENYWGNFRIDRFPGQDPGSVEIRGDFVASAAEHWILTHSSPRFFVFVHFYDLHGPYLLPAEWRRKFPGRIYDGELAYVDNLIGRLWAMLETKGIARRTVLIITADHGEGLGDHGEWNHGYFLYRSTLHVPLLIRFPDGRCAGQRATPVVRLIDIAPTAFSTLGIPIPRSFEGRSLMGDLAGRPLAPLNAYAETLYPYRHFHTAPLFALTSARYEYIQSPRSELYRLATDPREEHNLAPTSQALAESMQEELHGSVAAMGPAHSAFSALSPQTVELLKSLGYVGMSSAPVVYAGSHEELPDPKDRIALYQEFQRALELQGHGDYRDSALRLDQIASHDPKLVSVQIEAGLAWQRLHEDSRAIADFKAALRYQPESALAHYDLGISLGNLHEEARAVSELDVATQIQPWLSQAYTARGLDLARMGKLREAVTALSRALRIDPSDFTACLNRGKLEMVQQEWDVAASDVARARNLEPRSGPAHEALGTLAFYRGDLKRALAEYRESLRLDPTSSTAHSSLGLLYAKLGRTADARTQFQRALALDPRNQDALEGLVAILHRHE
jgi:arylsulfatase A-like enzyme/tetratricopeptide (TPR) repeat protein